MHPNLVFLSFCVVTLECVSCFYQVCDDHKNDVLNDDECSELYFEPTEKEINLGLVSLELEGSSLNVTPTEASWDVAFVRIALYEDSTKRFCRKLSNEGPKSYCVELGPEAENKTFLLEYKMEKLPETSSKKFLFSTARSREVPLFPYVELTDTSCLVLRAQKLPTATNITYYKVEAYKEKNNVSDLQDLRFFPHYKDISYELYTYNDEGSYYFKISTISDECVGDLCPKMSTPTVFIGRKSTRLVIGIVGASFILPFVLFIFHILTKKYPIEDQSEPEERLVVAYNKSSIKKHEEVVTALAALLEKSITNQAVDVIDLSMINRKFCNDSLILAARIIYVAPPRDQSESISLDKAMSDKEIYGVSFDYCSDQLLQFFHNHKIFRLFDDFDRFMEVLNASESHDSLRSDLRRKTEEAKLETEQFLNDESLPKIVVTDSEPQEHDSLISKVVL